MALTNQIQSTPLTIVNIERAQAKVIDMKACADSKLYFKSSGMKFLYRELQIINNQRG